MTHDAVPNAPLSHADPTEHRRLIADRANAIGYEEGVWTPTFDFAVTGDLVNVYTVQLATYWRMEKLVFFDLQCAFTPTFTTASGDAEIEGLPYPLKSGHIITVTTFRLNGPNVTWPFSDVVGFIRPDEQVIAVAFQGSLTAGDAMNTTHIASGFPITFRVNGFYPID